jgi:hypothetical protein
MTNSIQKKIQRISPLHLFLIFLYFSVFSGSVYSYYVLLHPGSGTIHIFSIRRPCIIIHGSVGAQIVVLAVDSLPAGLHGAAGV